MGVWRFSAQTEAEAEAVVDWANKAGLDIWLAETAPGFVDVMLPVNSPALEAILPHVSVRPTLFVDDVATRLQEQLVSAPVTAATDPGFFLQYHPYPEIESFMQDLAARNPTVASTFVLGTTVNGNAISGIKIARGNPKKHVFLTGAVHAREWISTATMTYFMHYLAELAGSHSSGTWVDNYAWTIVPVVNVDGYLWTWSNERLWRKNRRENSVCYGVDNNRNFGFKWATAGSSGVACAETFHGKFASSEPETQAVENYIDSLAEDLIAYLDVHAYGQLWMSPWGWTSQLPPLNQFWLQNNGSKAAVDAIYKVHQREYTYGPISTTIYPASGSSADFSYGIQNTLYSYALELRGTQAEGYGFLLPANQIIPQGQEFVAGMEALMAFIHKNPGV